MESKHELLEKLWAMERENQTKRMSGPHDIWVLLQTYARKKQEHFICVTLNGAHSIIKSHVITIGLINRTIVHPREVYRAAIIDRAAAIVVVHNHPSGNLEPSDEDCEITKVLKSAGDIIGIQMLDHIVISRTGYYSFTEKGQL